MERQSSQITPEVPKQRWQSLWLCLAATGFAVWLVALIGLALTSSSPITLNRLQILQADVIVEATIIDVAKGECRVSQSWPHGADGSLMRVRELADFSVVAGESYLLPVALDERGASHIARTPPPDSRALIYPATNASRRQLMDLRKR